MMERPALDKNMDSKKGKQKLISNLNITHRHFLV